MSYQTGYSAPRRRTSRTLIRLTVFVWLLVASCAGLRAFAIPFVNDLIWQRVAQTINPEAVLPSNVNPADAVRRQIESAPLPGLPSLSDGEFRITQEQATGYMASQASSLGLRDVMVQFEPGEVIATISADAPVLGQVSGTVRANARAENGRLVLDNERIDGVIGQVLNPQTLIDPLEDRLNRELERQDRRLEALDVRQGETIVTLE